MQSKIGITKLIKNFKFSPCVKTPIPMVFDPKSLFTAPKGGMWLKVERIKWPFWYFVRKQENYTTKIWVSIKILSSMTRF